jgi:hypothetical protein
MEEIEKIKPKLLIITGPQGSGNHLFAKIFSMHPTVKGWVMMKDEWQGHHQEPFNKYWQEPALLKDFKWDNTHYVTSISCPYYKDKKPQLPKYQEFITEAKKYADVVTVIIGRDRNILELQQKRVRGLKTYNEALTEFEKLYALCNDLHFISQELFFLYGSNYLKIVGKQIGFPIAYNHKTLLDDYLKEDSNSKYVKDIDKGKFDEQAKKSSLIDS